MGEISNCFSVVSNATLVNTSVKDTEDFKFCVSSTSLLQIRHVHKPLQSAYILEVL